MALGNLSVKFRSGVVGEDPTKNAKSFHNYLLERANRAGLEIPIVVKGGEGNVGEVLISAGDRAPIFLSWIREWRLENPQIVHEIQTPEGLPDDDFKKEIRAKAGG